MHKAIFTIDGFAPAYIGYTNGDRWNGWATPHFEKDEAFKVMADFNADADRVMQYDEIYDQFFTLDIDTMELETWKGEDIQTDEGVKHLYGIGAYSWVWDDINEGDHLYIAQQVEEFIFYHDTYQYMDEYDLKREEVVNTIVEQLKNLETFCKVICIMRNEKLSAEETMEALGKELSI